jgi:hypothetical protein
MCVILLAVILGAGRCADWAALDAVLDAKLLQLHLGTSLAEVARIGHVSYPPEAGSDGRRVTHVAVAYEAGDASVARMLRCEFSADDKLLSCAPEGGRNRVQGVAAASVEKVRKGMTMRAVEEALCAPGSIARNERGQTLFRYMRIPEHGVPTAFVDVVFQEDGRVDDALVYGK